MESIDLRLEGMAYGGNAIGRHEGRAVFVAYGLPGDWVRVRITADKGRYLVAEITEIIEPSDQRVQPRCRHYGHCGGCHWQHISYSAQLEFKRQIVKDQMKRIGGYADVLVRSTIPSPSDWEYRSHSTFHVTEGKQIGLVGTDNHSIVPIDECHIVPAQLFEFANKVVKNFSPNGRVRLQIGSEGQPIAFNMSHGGNVDDGAVYYTVRDRRFRWSAGSFFQVNLPQADTLVDLVLEYGDSKGNESVLELYSGVGLFTAFLAERAGQVTAVETSSTAVRDAMTNLAEFDNVMLIEADVDRALRCLGKARLDTVVLDPPRAGIEASAMKGLIQYDPQRVIYVSCDPVTLARDARRLRESNYQLVEVQPVDMFPQTYHIECVAKFEKRL